MPPLVPLNELQELNAQKPDNVSLHQEEINIALDNYLPEPCQRPRLGKNGNTYSPSATPERNMAMMVLAAISHIPNAPQTPFKGPCGVHITFCFHDNAKGDIDNRVKFVLDALQKAKVYSNDSQVHQLSAAYRINTKHIRTEIQVVQLTLTPTKG